MNILHVVPYFPPAICFGGVPEAVFDLVQAQESLGHSITVLTTDAGLASNSAREPIQLEWLSHGPIRAVGTFGNVRVLYVRNRSSRLANRRKVFTPRFSNAQIWARIPPRLDAVHFHEVHIPGYGRLAERLAASGAAVCLSAHGSFHPPTHRGLRRILHRTLDPLLGGRWISKVDTFFVLSEAERNQFLAAGVAPSRLVKMPLGQPRLEDTDEALPFEFPPSEHFTILYLGRLSAQKGLRPLMDAFLQLWKERVYTRLVLCGPDEGGIRMIEKMNRKAAIPLQEDSVTDRPGIYLLPPIPRSRIRPFYRSGDVTVCPSPYESFGLVPVESLLCGTPIVVSSSYGCLEHIYLTGEVVKVIPPNNSAGLKEALQALIRQKTRRFPELQGILPSWKALAESTIEIYQGRGPDRQTHR